MRGSQSLYFEIVLRQFCPNALSRKAYICEHAFLLGDEVKDKKMGSTNAVLAVTSVCES